MRDAAEQVLREAITIAPKDPQAKLMLVAFLSETKGIEAAEAALRQFVDAK